MYKAKGTYYCCSSRIFAIYPSSGIIPTSIPVKKFSLYIQDGTIKLVKKPT